jgi:hypothetical protein
MAKNFAAIYARTGDSIALQQSFFAVEETTKGTLKGPTGADFFYTRAGGAITHTQPKVSSEHRSGRHNNDIYAEKKSTEWTVPAFVNINTAVAAGATELDPAVRVLWKSLLGRETVGAGVTFDAATDPDITFSLFENGDKWSQQARGSFVESGTITLPGNGVSGLEFSGRCADRLRVGISKSVIDNDGGNTITLAVAAEAKRFPVGCLVMLVEANGTTRSADTADGTYRKVTARDTGTGIITVDGAALADADGSVALTPIYLCYAEPVTPVGISGIQTGLVGQITISGLASGACLRSATVTLTNNHEVVDYCYGHDGLDTPFFVPGGRLDVAVELEMNLNDQLIGLLDDLETFTSQNINLFLGNQATRHFKVELPKIIFDVPSTSLPESGSIPVSFSGMGFQTTLDAADEVKVKYL